MKVEMIEPMGEWAVKYAAEKWNIDPSYAAKNIAKLKLPKKIDKRDFLAAIE